MTHDKALLDLQERVKAYNPNADLDLIETAYKIAKFAHSGQFRESGENYLDHPIAVANILVDLKSDTTAICAALLHDVVEQTSTTIEDIRKSFNDEIATLVEALTNVDKFTFNDSDDYNAENIRRMLIASAKDIRVLIIKLADRLHNMETLKFLRPDKQKRIAHQTMDIYAPIAQKLGMSELKGQLEDLSFRYTNPVEYQDIKKHINKKREEREIETQKLIEILKIKLTEKGVNADVFGRAKYFYSIYKKMLEKQKDFEEIYDLVAIRIIVDGISECYAALGVVHELWSPKPGRFKDYIALPKANGYQSLHTSVLGDHGRYIEVQIRTKEMHILAEEGVAAHWKYKGTDRDKNFEKKIQWLKQILEWKQFSENAKDFVDTLKVDLFANEIVVLTPKSDPISLPSDATPVDFAFMVHSKLGLQCIGAIVNQKNVPLDTKLKSGDVVEILTSKKPTFSRQWLNFVVTNKAKSKIRSALGIVIEHNPKRDRLKQLITNPFKTTMHFLTENDIQKNVEISDDDAKKYPVKISKCCNPKLGEPICAFVTKDKKVTIHGINCLNIHSLENESKVDVKWRTTKPIGKLMITVLDKIGVLTKVLNGLSKYRVKMISIRTEVSKNNIKIVIEYEKESKVDMKPLVATILKLDFVVTCDVTE
ncbi:MAG: bifunctional (p)ppGpp synthetase/guanosine-3',5'-bis(diphosphate) 3'-pyrophosphohydrolase [Candidatus Woesearchaeota archaeon]|jgi:GTP pyrophosphokinase